MLLGSLVMLALALLFWLSAFVGTPMSEEELERLESRLDPDAHNQRRLQEMRQTTIAVSWFMIPTAVLGVLYALVRTVFG